MSALFISDLHLSADTPELNKALIGLLETTAKEHQQLYILGDLFEVWIGDDDPAEWLKPIKQALQSYSGELFFQHGNRDFLLGRRFCKQVGGTLLTEEFVFDQYGQKILLMHGDSLCTDDVDYMKFRRKVRSPLFQFLIYIAPLSYRQGLAKKWRAQSAQANAEKSTMIMDVNQEAVLATLQKHDVKTLLHGHTHRPAVHELETLDAQRIVLGDWHQTGWQAIVDSNGITLSEFKI